MPPDVVSLNGRILPRAEARIDPFDRGLVFGDALYEVVKVAGRRLLHLEPHMERLRSGLTRVEIPAPEGLTAACRELVDAAALESGSVYLQVTRGVAPRSNMPPRDLVPTVLIIPSRHPHDPPAGKPLAAVTMPDPRWRHCDVKTTSLMATVVGKLAARDSGTDEVVFVGPGGELREGGSTNLFVRRHDRLETYPLDGRILPGVTRALILRLAAEDGLPVVETPPLLAARDAWQEALLCGTLTGIQPLVSLDGEPVGVGSTAEWTAHLAHALEAHERMVRRTG